MEKNYYLVYRIYTRKEREDEKGNNHIYGWTDNKSVLRAFLKQRDHRKYRAIRVEGHEIGEAMEDPDEHKIDYRPLISATSEKEISFFMTKAEMIEAEIKIQRYFKDLASISDMKFEKGNKEITYFVNLFLNLQDKYQEALHFIGYRPKELDALFGSMDEEEDNYSDDVADKTIYSLESFIKVLREDL